MKIICYFVVILYIIWILLYCITHFHYSSLWLIILINVFLANLIECTTQSSNTYVKLVDEVVSRPFPGLQCALASMSVGPSEDETRSWTDSSRGEVVQPQAVPPMFLCSFERLPSPEWTDDHLKRSYVCVSSCKIRAFHNIRTVIRILKIKYLDIPGISFGYLLGDLWNSIWLSDSYLLY